MLGRSKTAQQAASTIDVRATPATQASPANQGSGSLLTPASAGTLLGVNSKCLERWRHTGAGPSFVKLSGKCVRYRKADLDAFVDARIRSSTAET
jgi:predicted DNA-binding transcriptional regulator AlpA